MHNRWSGLKLFYKNVDQSTIYKTLNYISRKN